jgi:hypothetical protein
MYKVKNTYYKKSGTSEARFHRVLKAFTLDLAASDRARLSGISLRPVNTRYLKMQHALPFTVSPVALFG